MDERQVRELFDRYLEARAKADRLANELKEVKAAEPRYRSQYESFADFFSDFEAVKDWRLKVKALEAQISEAKQEQQEIANRLLRILQTRIWFRHRDVGIGLAYSNWGGCHHYVEVQPWSDNMPSLDHTYRGD